MNPADADTRKLAQLELEVIDVQRALLRFVESGVGELEQTLRVVGLGRALGDAVRERRARAVAELAGPDALEQHRHVVGIGVGQDHRELVAADARRVVTESQDPAEPLAERLERGVAGGMPVGVVDLLEAVEVDDDEREGPVVPEAAGDRHLEQAVEAAPVEEPGERVVPGVVAEHVEAQRDHAEALSSWASTAAASSGGSV